MFELSMTLTFVNEHIFIFGTPTGKIYLTDTNPENISPEYLGCCPDLMKDEIPIVTNLSKPMKNQPSKKTWNSVKSFASLSISKISSMEILAVCKVNLHQSKHEFLLIVVVCGIHIFDLTRRCFVSKHSLSDCKLADWSYAVAASTYVTTDIVWIFLTSGETRSALISLDLRSNYDFMNNKAIMPTINGECQSSLSFLASTALSESSPFSKAMRRLISKSAVGKNEVCRKSSVSSLNHPVTFGHRIRSSGYASNSASSVMFKPQKQFKNRNISFNNTKKILPNNLESQHLIASGPFLCRFVDSLDTHDCSSIYALAYSPSGDRLAIAQGNNLCTLFKLSSFISPHWVNVLPKPCTVLSGHQAAVTDVGWSQDGRYLLTCSMDKTACLWQTSLTANSSCGLKVIISSPNGGNANGHGQTIRTANSLKKGVGASLNFVEHLRFGQFHLQDSFFHVSCRNKIYFFMYEIQQDVDALHKCHKAASYKPIQTFEFNECSRLTAVASANMFYSYLLVSAGSDRFINVLDINTGDYVRRILSLHSTTITGLAINQGCVNSDDTGLNSGTLETFVGCGVQNYNMYASVAPGDCVRLWDLRVSSHHVAELVRCEGFCFSEAGHLNASTGGAVRDSSVPPVTLQFSPCGRRLCVGALGTNSPNMNPVVFDLRKTRSENAPCYLKLFERQSSNKLATVVSWNPTKQQISTGTLDGRLAIFE